MKYTEAFEALGYTVEAPRQDWTAEKPGGVCISLWSKEMGSREGALWMNTKVHAQPLENWREKAGNRKRIRHLRRALDEFDGRVDVVIVSGTPGVGYGSAQPWIAEGGRTGTYWQVTELEDETGHFAVEMRRARAA
jgi:hypothetical protein